MRKLKLLIAACALTLGAGQTWAQTDVTDTYLTNAGFETDGSKDATTTPTGWTLVSSSGSYTSYRPINATSTPNGSKKVTNGSKDGAAEGSCYLYMRTNWGGSSVIDLAQTTSATLPVGHYVLKADILQPYTTSGMPTLTMSAKNGNTNLANVSVTNQAPIWKTFSVEFNLSEATSVTVDLNHATGTGNNDGCLSLVDNIRLIQYNYSTLQTLIDEAEDLYDAGGTNASTFNTAINTAKGVNSSADLSDIVSAIETLENAINAYRIAQYVAPDNTDYSSWIANYTLDTNEGGTVFASQGTNWGSQIPVNWTVARNTSGAFNTKTVDSGQSGKGFETWSNNTTAFMTLYQSISSLPAGHYTLSAYMQHGGRIFVENGSNEPAYSSECADDAWTKYSVSFIKENADDIILIGTVPSSRTANNDTFGQYDEFSLTCNGIDLSALKNQITDLQKDAIDYLADANYTNVIGEERTTLTTQSTATAASNTVSAYNTLLSNVQVAINAFVAAKDSYDALVAMRTTGGTYTTVDWPRASTTKKTALDDAITAAEPTDAADAVTKTNAIVTAYRQFVESNGLAEGVAEAVDYTNTYLAGADPDVNTGWTDGINTDWRSQEIYTKGDGNQGGKYYDGGWSDKAAVNINMTRELTLPAGQYQLQITARGSADLTSYSMSIGGQSVNLPCDGSGTNVGTFGHGWSDKFVVFDSDGTTPLTLAIAATSTNYYQWISFNRLRLMKLDATLADDTDYSNLNDAIDAVEANLGFEDGEYAPYNNTAAMAKLAEAKAINQNVNNVQEDVQALTTYLNTAANWTANTEEVNAVANGNFANNESMGWEFSVWGEFVSGLNANTNASNGTARSSNAGTLTYGNTTGYTMPLKDNTVYRLTFKVSSWDNSNKNNGTDVSILNSSNEGLAVTSFGASSINRDQDNAFKTYTTVFKTGAAGNYTLVIKAKGNRSVYTDIVLKKAAPETITVTSAGYATYVSDNNLDYTNVTGLTAYKATFDTDGETINFTKVTTVPAGEGVLLKGEANTYSVPVTTGVAAWADADNDFIRGTGAAVESNDGTTHNYVLSSHEGNVGFYPASGKTIATDKAYLSTTVSATRLTMTFDGEASGISTVITGNNSNEAIYNLNGQRINTPRHGLYIQNGKKFMVK